MNRTKWENAAFLVCSLGFLGIVGLVVLSDESNKTLRIAVIWVAYSCMFMLALLLVRKVTKEPEVPRPKMSERDARRIILAGGLSGVVSVIQLAIAISGSDFDSVWLFGSATIVGATLVFLGIRHLHEATQMVRLHERKP